MTVSERSNGYVLPGYGFREEENSEYKTIEAVGWTGAVQEGAHNSGEAAPLLLTELL